VGALHRYAGIATTAAIVVGGLALFVGLFFAWVIAPLLGVLLFYVVFVLVEERPSLERSVRRRFAQRQERLRGEARARRAALRRAVERHEE
jgi:phosphate/sulfate permease